MLPIVEAKAIANASKPMFAKFSIICLLAPTAMPKKNNKTIIMMLIIEPTCLLYILLRMKQPTAIPDNMNEKMDSISKSLNKQIFVERINGLLQK